MKIITASLDYKNQYSEYVHECYHGGISHYADAVIDPHAYLQRLVDNSFGRHLPIGYVASTTFFCMSENRILGTIRLRHDSNDYIHNVIGHIGYDTRPSERGRGVAQKLLNWVKNSKLTEDVIITCKDENVASRKVIESCGGEYLSRYYDSDKKEMKLRYKLSCMCITHMSLLGVNR